MTRVFRAFLWMRWRIFVNSLERTGARDTLEELFIDLVGGERPAVDLNWL